MREIKFRGLDTEGIWHYGFIVRLYFSEVKKKWVLGIQKKLDRYACGMMPIITESLGEYTGLDDKKGKEIYEGDIVKVGYDNLKVEWSYYVGLKIGSIDLPTLEKKIAEGNTVEIIGNIHENPELLEQQ